MLILYSVTNRRRSGARFRRRSSTVTAKPASAGNNGRVSNQYLALASSLWAASTWVDAPEPGLPVAASLSLIASTSGRSVGCIDIACTANITMSGTSVGTAVAVPTGTTAPIAPPGPALSAGGGGGWGVSVGGGGVVGSA